MQTKPITSKEYFKGLKVVHFALMAGLVFFILVTVLLLQAGEFDMGDGEFTTLLGYVVLLFGAGAIIASQVVFKARLKKIKMITGLPEKLTEYRSALIVRYALLEAPAFFGIVAALLTGELLFLGLAAIIILLFLFISPSATKAGNDLEIDQKEKQTLADPNAVVGSINIEN